MASESTLVAKRKVQVEGTFGLAKELHGLRRTRFKGRRKVQIQLWLTAAAMNMKRAVAAMSRGTPTAAGARAALSAVARWVRRLLAHPAMSATTPTERVHFLARGAWGMVACRLTHEFPQTVLAALVPPKGYQPTDPR